MSKFAMAHSMKKKMKKECHGGEYAEGGALHEDIDKMSGKSGMVRMSTEANHNQREVHQTGNNGRSGGRSDAGNRVRNANLEHSNYKDKDLAEAKQIHHETLSDLRSMPKPNLPMAEGGHVMSRRERMMHAFHGGKMAEGGFIGEEKASGFVEHEEDDVKHDEPAMHESERKLNQHGMYEEGHEDGGEGFHDESYMGNPGNAHDEYQSPEHEEDMVSRIMKSRQHMYSEGGRIANGGEDDLDRMADSKPNNFDDLALDDHLEGHNSGADDGDSLGNHQEDEDRKDIISKVMASRRKKDRLPNPR